jgi:hypothetical protein
VKGFRVLASAPALLLDATSDNLPRGVMFAPVRVSLLAMLVSLEALAAGMFLTGDSLRSMMLLPGRSFPFGLLGIE